MRPTHDEDRMGDAWKLFGPSMLRVAVAIVGPSDARDVVANAFLRVTAQPEWWEIENLCAYLRRAVRNEALNSHRALRRRRQREIARAAAGAPQDASADLDVRLALARLTIRQRTVVFLVYWEQMTEEQIARELGITRSTVHRTLGRARRQLKRWLE